MLRGGAVALAVLASPTGGAVAVPVGEAAGGYLTAGELRTLRALTDRVVPADLDPGAVVARCAEAIDALLAAFRTDPPRIYAGAPFSDRSGSPVNHFAEFLPLDAYEQMAWRLRIEGSGGRPELERNGPVVGLQAIYRDGLAALDRAAGPRSFAGLTPVERDLLLRTSRDPAVASLTDVAVLHTFELMYGAPEYGGNADLVGWSYTRFDGDVQPRGWTREEIEQRDHGSPPLPALSDLSSGVPVGELLAGVALAQPETVMGLTAHADGRLGVLQERVRSLMEQAQRGMRNGW